MRNEMEHQIHLGSALRTETLLTQIKSLNSA